jgi:hypothetical protein
MTWIKMGQGWVRSDGSERKKHLMARAERSSAFFYFFVEVIFIMAENRIENRRKRLGEINDRKIEILLEFGLINKRIEELRSEYSRLDKEYYELWIDQI